MGVELKTSAYHALKDGQIKLLDVITHLNEEKIVSSERFDESTWDKTRPMLTIRRNHNTASGKKGLLQKSNNLCFSAEFMLILYCLYFCSKGEVPISYARQSGHESYPNS